MRVNFNRSVKFLFILIFLVVTGCSTTSNSFNDRPPDSSETDNSYVRHALHPFGKQKYNVPVKYKNTVWERLISLYSLPEIQNERIDRELNWYLRHPAYLARVQQRAEPYLHLILDEVEAKNIPGELALLPIVESAFLPEAYSKSDASGLWQFIPATGRLYGLQQNTWYDGRRDVYASTKAATAFLKHLGETFDGDWHLALASYNYGKGNVRKAIEKNENLNRDTDYWSLDLPKETADYVPRLLAIAKIFANADKYNVQLQNIPNRPYC
ncbi:MAG: transglycosylase SLT domain-containing protein [Hydrogenophaga sp.]|nr:transglycosylase SLT domain-containing protein [Hydrogenophaga sp.]